MGIISPKQQKATPGTTKRRSTQLDFSNLGELKPDRGTVGFSAFRENDPSGRRTKSRKKSNGSVGGAMVEDSDDDEDDAELVGKMEDIDDKDAKTLLSPEDAKYSGELADGVGRIKACSTLPFLICFTNIFTAQATTLGRTTWSKLSQVASLGYNINRCYSASSRD